MNEMMIFESGDFGAVRTIQIGEKTYFMGQDVTDALGYTNSRAALARHCKGVTKRDTLTSTGVQAVNFIPEGDIYRLIVKSKLPAAEQFESWIFDEVIPAIRAKGIYLGQEMAQFIEKFGEFLERQSQINDYLMQELAKLGQSSFSNSESLDDGEQKAFRRVVNKRAMELLGGRGSNACNDDSIRRQTFASIYIQVRDQFDVSTYKGIKRTDFSAAIDFVKECWPPVELYFDIDCINCAH
jgi:prophage antirepressor-like protein